jgi:hypothetical protein
MVAVWVGGVQHASTSAARSHSSLGPIADGHHFPASSPPLHNADQELPMALLPLSADAAHRQIKR